MHAQPLPRLKAPREHGALLSYPPLDDAGTLIAENQARAAAASVTFDGRSLAELRDLARQETLAVARQYLEEAGEPAPDWLQERVRVAHPTSGPWLVAGHQPELFHPGVWVKNFALQQLARRHHGVPLNLVVDNDTVKSTHLRVPHEGRIIQVPFDRWRRETPYEHLEVADEALWNSLPERVEPLTRTWPFRPLLPEFWREVRGREGGTRLVGERIARGRRALERAWGSAPFETPLSRLCGTSAFGWFAAHLLGDGPRFHAAYNAAVHAYRRRHGLRSVNHPVPDLARDGAWLETPFWVWRAADPRRRRLFARADKNAVHLRAGGETLATLSGTTQARAEGWQRLEAAGLKLRTRALTTTLFARLLLADLFIHGIGGGKYDEVTDAILRDFYGLPPPSYLVLSATLLLPLERFPDADAESRRLQALRRDLTWNPQRHLVGADGAAAALAARKQRLIDGPASSAAERQARYHALRAANEPLRGLVAPQTADIERRLSETERRGRLHRLHSSRDYPFCLYPEEMLRSFFSKR